MNIIDQNSIIKSQEDALVPGPLLIDGRTEQDMLYFLTEFATLINFYDNTNTVSSNWAPFLLKDPVFLLAAISKTNFTKYQSQYREISLKLEQIYGSEARAKVVVPTLINQLFDLLTGIFIKIERWTYYMQNSAPQYNLKKYVLDQVKTNFSVYLWAIVALRDKLSQTSPIQGIDPVKYYLFDSFDKVIWKQNKDKSPYWQVLGAPNLEYERNDLLDLWGVFSALTKAGDELFNFFYTIVSQSSSALESLKKQKSNYPDTTLLRTFVNLLQGHQEQLNAISQKHLQFYYEDILKQTIKPAIADSVFVYAMLAQKAATFKLPAGTLLNAGIDAQKNPILFATSTDVELNPATITSAYTLNKVVTGKLASLYLQGIPTSGALKQDINGKTIAWDTFGNATNSIDTLAQVGIAFASPMLLLREGSRKIILTMNYTTAIDQQMLVTASYYLSTQNAWLQVIPSFASNKNIGLVNQFIIEFDLNAAQPAIEAFLIDPDGLQSVWPMLKITFASFTNTEAAPVISSIKIEVDVLNVKTFQLYNDHGALSTKTPYQLFGPLPLVNSNFIIGNSEIFSKPVSSLSVEFTWNNLPIDFATYYNEYNNYLNPPPAPVSTPQPAEKSFITKVWDTITDKHDVSPTPVAPADPAIPPVFNNCSFGVNFKLLKPQGWATLKVSNQMGCTVQTCTSGCIYTQQIQNPLPGDPPVSSTLFSTSCIKVKPGENAPIIQSINNSSFFAFDNNGSLPYDPTVQLSPLKYSETSTAGFMKMELAIPQYGFGSELYPKVVANIATLNALTVYQIAADKSDDDKKKDETKIIQPANTPFAPEVSDLVAHYSASQTYTFNYQTGTYPIQCFLYAPFQSQEVYNSTVGNIGSYYAVDEPRAIVGGIPLFPAINYSGYLFLGMDDLIPANAINLYFEFSRKYGVANPDKSIVYSYLGIKGWSNLSVLNDGTNGLSCSGILKVSVPEDITNQNTAMPGNKYWIAIKVNDPTSYADTIFVTTNGFAAIRTGNTFLSSDEAPHIPSNSISKFQTVIPQVIGPMQPFASFGGKPAELVGGMNQRVSSRLKTKDRAVNPEDYFRLIKHEYPEIYYSKTVFNRNAKTTNVYVVKGSKSSTDQDAFRPMITECKEENITSFLAQRASVFAGLIVSNFNFLYVCVNATISINPGFEPKGLQRSINEALNIFLSPWITNDGVQINIDQSLSDTIVARFLKSITGVAGVKSVLFQSSTSEDNISTASYQRSVIPSSDDLLIVPHLDHQITIEQ
jgi:hypothetical protein